MTSKELKAYLGKGVLAGGAAAAIALAVTNNRQKEAKKKDVGEFDNSLVIPIHKDKFLEGLPTPQQFAESRGETVTHAIPVEGGKALPAPSADQSVVPQMSEADILAKKKELLRNNSHRLNFFGKNAEEGNVDDEESDKKKSDEGNAAVENKPEKNDDGGDGTGVPRDDQGRFISPTSPLAVKQVLQEEKKAGWLSEISERPLAVVGGGATAIMIADMIMRAVNKRREKDAAKSLAEEREKYVDMIQNSSDTKQASAEKRGWSIGELGAGAFIIPASVTWLITKQILDNRKADKKRDAKRTDSYPDEPVVTYRVYDNSQKAQA